MLTSTHPVLHYQVFIKLKTDRGYVTNVSRCHGPMREGGWQSPERPSETAAYKYRERSWKAKMCCCSAAR